MFDKNKIAEKCELLRINEHHFTAMRTIQDVESMIQRVLLESVNDLDYHNIMSKVIDELAEMHRKELAKVTANLDKMSALDE